MDRVAIHKHAHIHAPGEKVWKVLFDDESFKTWCAVFSPGSHAVTDWKEGSDVKFMDESNSGIFGKIMKHVPNEIMVIQYSGEIVDGKEDRESESAKAMNGALEVYRMHEHDGVVHLDIQSEMTEEMANMMDEKWDEAIDKIIELAEK